MCLNHSPNNMLLSKSFKTPFSSTISPKTPQISQISTFHEKSTHKSIHNSQKTKTNHLSTQKDVEKSPDFEKHHSFMTNNKKVYQIGSLSIEKTSKPPESNKENLLSEIKSLNEKFNFIILSSDQKSNIPQNLSKASISQEHEGEIRKKLGDRTNSVFSKKSDVKALDFDKEIKDFKNFDGLDFESQRKQLEKYNLQRKIEVSVLDREIAQKSEDLHGIRKEFEELVVKLREKKGEFQKISIEFDLFFQQCDLKQKQYDFNKQQENIRTGQEKTEIETNKQKIERFEQDLKEREVVVMKKEKENAEILKEIEGQIHSLDMRKYEIAENLKKCYDFEAEFNIRSEKQQEKEKVLSEEKRNLEEISRKIEEKTSEIARKENDIANQTDTLTQKIKEIELLERTLRKNAQENQEKETHLMKKEKELCKVIEEIKLFSNNLKNEKQQQENRFKGWEDALKRKDDELNMKERVLIEKSSKDEDLELKLLGLKMNEDTFKKKLDLEIRNYQFEIQKLMEKEKDLMQREKKVVEYEKKIKNQKIGGNNNNTFMNMNSNLGNFNKYNNGNNDGSGMSLGVASKNILKNELQNIFNQEKKAHRLQKSQSFIVLRKHLSNLEE